MTDGTNCNEQIQRANTLLETKENKRAIQEFQSILQRFAGELAPEQVIQIYHSLAIASKATGDLAPARMYLERILEADGSQTKSLELLIEVCREMDDWNAVAYYMEFHAERQTDEDLKCNELMEIAKIYEDKSGDLEHAIETYNKVLKIAPTSRMVFNELLRIYSSLGQWENSISVIEKLCDTESDSQKKAKFYFTIGVVYRDELSNNDKAVEYFNRTLDANVKELRAFEAIHRILSTTQEWKKLEKNYHAMIKRVDDAGIAYDPDLTNAKRLLWHGLGEIYQDHLDKPAQAIEAFNKERLY